jgi:hypothetical protein
MQTDVDLNNMKPLLVGFSVDFASGTDEDRMKMALTGY